MAKKVLRRSDNEATKGWRGSELEVPPQLLMDGGVEGLVVQTDEPDGIILAGEGDLGAAEQVEPAGVGTEVEQLLLGMGDQAQVRGTTKQPLLGVRMGPPQLRE